MPDIPLNQLLSWQVGDVKISRVCEMVLGPFHLPRQMFPDASAAEVRAIDWLKAPHVDDEGNIYLSFHALVVETPTKKIVVDTCFGNSKQRGHGVERLDGLNTPFLTEFGKAGVTPQDIDLVVCTHLHIDHVGWNTMLIDGVWVPTFANARTLVSRTEFEFWRAQEQDALHRIVFADSVQPLWDAGLIDLVDDDHRLCPEVSLLPTPGHSPGHVCVRIQSRGEEALITGDAIHHPVQMAHPDWCSDQDHDREHSKASRSRLLADCAQRGVLVIGTHFMTPTAVRICQAGSTYRFAPPTAPSPSI